MSQAKQASPFYADYNLNERRREQKKREPASHQKQALDKLHNWYRRKANPPHGGILVLPTGGGKTFTAIHFAAHGPLIDGSKVLWLAHTHHLLEQAFRGFEELAGLIVEPKRRLAVRVVSGATGSFPVHTIRPEDDVVIASLPSMVNAHKNEHPHWNAFLKAAGSRLLVVFDEAHHSPAPSYRGLLTALRERCPQLFLLGMTATPIYADERKQGWLAKLFPQNFLYQVDPKTLMAEGILAKPMLIEAPTHCDAEFEDREFQKWTTTFGDIPEEVIDKLARNQQRNDTIVAHYVEHRKRYGKTIIFADRWFQCVYLREALQKRDVRADAIFAFVAAREGTAEERNRREKSENAEVLDRFRKGELDVLINVRMATEGTDIPDVQTVFLTRQTRKR